MLSVRQTRRAALVGLAIFAALKISIDPITWDSAVSVGLFLIAVGPAMFIWQRKWRRNRELFTVEYESHDKDTNVESQTAIAGTEVFRFDITYRIKPDSNVEFLTYEFRGTGTKPILYQRGDWQNDVLSTSDFPLTGGKVYENFEPAWHRLPNSRITRRLGVKVPGSFSGHLILGMTTTEVSKERCLPFEVVAPDS